VSTRKRLARSYESSMLACNTSSDLELKHNHTLKPYTTFKIGGAAKYFVAVQTPSDLQQALAFRSTERLGIFVLGGGSNILVSDIGFDGLVVHPVQPGIAIVSEDAEAVIVRVHAAEIWDRVVACAVEHGWWGIENLSHIPGQAGAALVQNIGAYGQQISDVLLSAEVMEIESGASTTLQRADCGLGYRRSNFNTSRKGQLVILEFTLRLVKSGQPNLEYPDVSEYFDKREVKQPALAQIRQAIIAIRDRKFPFPREERGGNAGSFFKNLVLSPTEYETLEGNLARNLGLPAVRKLLDLKKKFGTRGSTKVPTAFLMEACGLKGYRLGGAKVNERQPLVLLNEGGATATDVLNLARHIRRTIYSKTGMAISLEPELVGFSQAEIAHCLSLE
jgi:UDP-N-acetylmuramate dehydrogenase